MKAVILISHGSRLVKTKEEVHLLIERIKSIQDIPFIECAFLELETPSIPEAIASCIEKGAQEIIILLNFLNAGRHVDTDIPNIVNEARVKYPGVNFRITEPIGRHRKIPELFVEVLNSHFDPRNENQR